MILAIDPTFSSFGYALLDGCLNVVDVGVFVTKKDQNKKTRVSNDDSFRAQQLSRMIGEYILKNKVKGIMGERPSGSQTAMAMKSFCTANTIIDCISALMNIPVEWCTPLETKIGFCMKRTAGKKDIMDAACLYYNWKILKKDVKTGSGIRVDSVYYPLGIKMGAGTFEHIADALSAFQFLKAGSQIVKLFSDSPVMMRKTGS